MFLKNDMIVFSNRLIKTEDTKINSDEGREIIKILHSWKIIKILELAKFHIVLS